MVNLFFVFGGSTAYKTLSILSILVNWTDFVLKTSASCTLFEESQLCISGLTNLLDRQPADDEVTCQELCRSHTGCTFFTFMESSFPLDSNKPDLQCYLWKNCPSKVGLMNC